MNQAQKGTVAAAGTALAGVMVLAWALKAAFDLDIPSDVQNAIATVIMGIAGLFIHKGAQ